MKKFTAILLAVILCAGVLLACNTESPQDGNQNITAAPNDGGGAAEGSQEQAEEVKIEPDLPENTDFGGYTFTVLSHREESDDWYQPDPREIISESEIGEPINDAVFRRNLVLSDKYGFELDLVTNTDEVALLRRAVNAGDDLYDAVIIFNNNVPGAVQNDLLTDISMLPYIDMDKPWWDSGVNSMSVAGKNFLLAGDMLILDNEATNALCFNKDLMRTLGKELPYNLVMEGKWTFDRMEELVRDAAADLNGDGQMTPDDDRWGFVIYKDTLHALLVSGGGSFAEKDEHDIPFMSFATERNITVAEKAMDMLYDSNYTMNIQRDVPTGGTGNPQWTSTIQNVFAEDRTLFMWVRMRVVEKYRGMESAFGILPMPKYDENQPAYRSVVNPYTGVLLGVPKSAQDLERTSIILEAVAAESRYTLQPAYYDVVLQRKFTRDEESSDMLDIIFSTRVYDIGGVYSFGNVFMDYIELSMTHNRAIASYYERRSATMERDIDRLVTRIQDMD